MPSSVIPFKVGLSKATNPSVLPLTIELVNKYKADDAMFVAIRFDERHRMCAFRDRRIVCKCKCGTIFSSTQRRIVEGNTYSCSCKRRQNTRARSVEQINAKKLKGCRLTAIRITPHIGVHRTAIFKCSCGVEKNITIYSVISGNTTSCGCFAEEKMNSPRKYSVTIKKLRNCYTDMMRRCYEPRCRNYRHYGAKGVIVCEEWKNSYQAFLDWALKSGWEQGLQLDKDKIGNSLLYSPETCCWLTFEENNKIKKNGNIK